MDKYPDAEFIAHPECEKPVLLLAHHIGSTSSLLKYVKESKTEKFIVATESGILHQMTKERPGKIFIPAPAIDSTCGCNDCSFMKLNKMCIRDRSNVTHNINYVTDTEKHDNLFCHAFF